MTVAASIPAQQTQEPFVGHILLDVPAAEPVLGFAEIAKALADIVQQSRPRFAVGIFGSWGSGKSTLMEAIAQNIDQSQAVVVEFNAWRYEREPHLILPLLDTIRDGLSEWALRRPADQRQQAVSIAGRIGRVVRALARGFSAEVGMPGAGSVRFDVDKALDALSAAPEDVVRSPQSVYYAAFSELRAAFQEVEQAAFSRIVVFVDDLDRCLPASALAVIESMKLFFDMPGFVFVVGMDERVVERAVREKYRTRDAADDGAARDVRVEKEYVKKIFQVPYSLPGMAPGQLGELLGWMDQKASMSGVQRDDLRDRVRRFLRHVAVEGRINPREVKRFVNAYTLQRMIRPTLDADTILSLQTLDFRDDWEDVYTVLSSEPDVFVDALHRYRDGDEQALENLWPLLSVLSLDLIDYLKSDEAAPLATEKNLERYLSSLQSTRSALPWLHEAMREVGQLRQIVRSVDVSMQFASSAAHDVAEQMQSALARLSRYQSDLGDVGSRLAPGTAASLGWSP